MTARVFRSDLKSDIKDGLIPFLGRSNVGKSTLLNRLSGRRMARTGKRPGLTDRVYLYPLRNRQISIVLADMPGFGYVPGGDQRRKTMIRSIRKFFRDHYASIICSLLLFDCRRIHDIAEPTPPDILVTKYAIEYEWLAMLERMRLPTAIILTKMDAIPSNAYAKVLDKAARILRIEPEDIFAVSSKTGKGIAELRDFLKAAKHEDG